jgi:hypothetical protein
MQKRTAVIVVLGTLTLVACASKTDANEKNFGAALTQYFDKKGDLCLNTKRWPVDVTEMDLRLQKTMQTGTANRMAALEAAGLVKGEDTELDIMGIMGKPTVEETCVLGRGEPFALLTRLTRNQVTQNGFPRHLWVLLDDGFECRQISGRVRSVNHDR